MQCKDHQAKPDQNPPDLLKPVLVSRPECNNAASDQEWRQRKDVERKNLNDQRCSDIRTEHDRQRRHQADQSFGGK